MDLIRRFSIVAAAAACLSPSAAHASGYLAARFGSAHGTPAMANPYAVYYNPAAMGGVTGTQLTLDLSIALRQASYARSSSALSPSSPELAADPAYRSANIGDAQLSNLLALPYLGAVSDLGTKNLRVGYAFYVPFGGMTRWSKSDNADPVAADGPQRWHIIEGKLLAIHNTFAASYTFEPAHLTVGANLSVVLEQVETVRARNANGSDDTTTGSGALVEGRSHVTASGVDIGAGLGLFWDPRPDHKLRLGASYTFAPGFGETRWKGKLTQQFGGVRDQAKPVDVDFLQRWPDVARLGAVVVPTKELVVRADLEYVRWSVFERQCVVAPDASCDVRADGSQAGSGVILNVPRNWKDAVGVRAGGGYFLEPELELFGSVGVTTAAAPKSEVDPSTIDNTRLSYALGARWEATSRLALAGSFNHSYMVPLDTKGAVGVDTYKAPSRSPSSDGKYRQNIYYLNVNGTVRF